MERKHLSQQIGQILDDLSRLTNTLYAMGTSDIQRYPDNYEVLSTDAALRADCLLYTSSRPTAYNLVKQGVFHSVRVGGHIRISKKSFDDWLDHADE